MIAHDTVTIDYAQDYRACDISDASGEVFTNILVGICYGCPVQSVYICHS